MGGQAPHASPFWTGRLTAQDGLLAHQVTLDLRDEGALQHARAVAAGGRGIGLGDLHAVAVRVVLGVHRDQSGHAEAALVLLADLSAGALRRHHDHREVGPHLHALLDNVEAVAVRQRRTLLHERDEGVDDRGVLLVRRQVEHEVGGRHELVVGADLEAVRRRVDVARPLGVDSALPQRVADIAAGIAHVQALVETLRAAANDDDLLLRDLLDAVGELTPAHEPASAELVQPGGHGERVEVVNARHGGRNLWSCVWSVGYGWTRVGYTAGGVPDRAQWHLAGVGRICGRASTRPGRDTERKTREWTKCGYPTAFGLYGFTDRLTSGLTDDLTAHVIVSLAVAPCWCRSVRIGFVLAMSSTRERSGRYRDGEVAA